MISFSYNTEEIKLFKRLNSPQKIQNYLNFLPFNFEKRGETCMSPREVVRKKTAHCMEGAMLAAAILEFHGNKPLVLDLRSGKNLKDFDHIVTVFKKFGCFGAISKTNHGVLRYREPIYKTLRELVLSYFHEYFLDTGVKTLREYSLPVNLSRFNKLSWRTSPKNLFKIPQYIDKVRHYPILSKNQIKNLRKADKIEIEVGKLTEYPRK